MTSVKNDDERFPASPLKERPAIGEPSGLAFGKPKDRLRETESGGVESRRSRGERKHIRRGDRSGDLLRKCHG